MQTHTMTKLTTEDAELTNLTTVSVQSTLMRLWREAANDAVGNTDTILQKLKTDRRFRRMHCELDRRGYVVHAGIPTPDAVIIGQVPQECYYLTDDERVQWSKTKLQHVVFKHRGKAYTAAIENLFCYKGRKVLAALGSVELAREPGEVFVDYGDGMPRTIGRERSLERELMARTYRPGQHEIKVTFGGKEVNPVHSVTVAGEGDTLPALSSVNRMLQETYARNYGHLYGFPVHDSINGAASKEKKPVQGLRDFISEYDRIKDPAGKERALRNLLTAAAKLADEGKGGGRIREQMLGEAANNDGPNTVDFSSDWD